MIALLTLFVVGAVAGALLGGVQLGYSSGFARGRNAERRRVEREECERQQALAALAGPEAACPYVIRPEHDTTHPCGHNGRDANNKPITQSVQACQEAKRIARCLHQEGDHLHVVCSLCNFEWLRTIR